MVLPPRDTSDTSLKSVGDLLDDAFGDEDENTVDFRLVHAILLVLARALCILERQVIIKLPLGPSLSYASSMVMSEVKVKTKGDKKKKGKKGKTGDSDAAPTIQLKRADTSADKSAPKKPRREQLSPDSDEPTKKRQQQEDLSTDRSSKKSRKESIDDLLDERFDDASEKTSKKRSPKSHKDSDEDYADTDQTISDKTKSTDKHDTYKSGLSKKTDEFDKYEQNTGLSKKTDEFDKDEQFDQDEDFNNFEEFDIDEESDYGEDEEFDEEEGLNKTKKPTKTGKAGKTGKSAKSSKSRKTERSASKSDESEKRTSEGYPSSRIDKISSKEALESDTKAKRSSVSGELIGGKDQTQGKTRKRKKDKDSSQDDFSIVPSGESSESQQEKIIIVETLPAGAVPIAKTGSPPIPQSLVTTEQFQKLVSDVIKLQDRFGKINIPGMENADLLLALQKKASLSDPLAAIQLSARLETVENSLKQMLIILKDLAKKAADGKLTQTKDLQESIGTTDTVTNKSTKGTKQTLSSEKSKIKQVSKADQEDTKSIRGTKSSRRSTVKGPAVADDSISVIADKKDNVSMISITGPDDGTESIITDAKTRDLITYGEMRDRLKELQEWITKATTAPINRAQLTAENALTLAHDLANKLISSLNLGDKMNELEDKISAYSEKINTFDAQFSSMITNYQEELQLMQHNLEIALENMAEALANRESDTEAATELNNRFTILQYDIERTMSMQSELKYSERSLYTDLRVLYEQIELLKDMKSDRDEVEEALSTKASISILNDKVALPQYEAVIGDYQKRIASAYEKFNSQEMIWQKYIDDLSRDMNEKAEKFQVDSLRKNLCEVINMLMGRLDFMLDICGEPRINHATRAMMRDHPCLSCATPAIDKMDKPDDTRKLEHRLQPVGSKEDVDDKKDEEDGDGDKLRPCIPNMPILHPLDIRAHTCPKYCGGIANDDLETNDSEGIASSITVRALRKKPVEERVASTLKKPCVPCNTRKKKVSYTESLKHIKRPVLPHQALDENAEEIEIGNFNVGPISEMMFVTDDPLPNNQRPKEPEDNLIE